MKDTGYSCYECGRKTSSTRTVYIKGRPENYCASCYLDRVM